MERTHDAVSGQREFSLDSDVIPVLRPRGGELGCGRVVWESRRGEAAGIMCLRTCSGRHTPVAKCQPLAGSCSFSRGAALMLT